MKTIIKKRQNKNKMGWVGKVECRRDWREEKESSRRLRGREKVERERERGREGSKAEESTAEKKKVSVDPTRS